MFLITLFLYNQDNNDIIIIDEPETHESFYLDIIIEKLLSLKNKKTFIISTHNINFTRKLADYVIYIEFGKLIRNTTSKRFFSSKNKKILNVVNLGC